RVLRYLATNLSAPEIARELSLSVHTVRTHVRHLFAKLGAHGRTEAVARARGLGLLAPSGRTTRRFLLPAWASRAREGVCRTRGGGGVCGPPARSPRLLRTHLPLRCRAAC